MKNKLLCLSMLIFYLPMINYSQEIKSPVQNQSVYKELIIGIIGGLVATGITLFLDKIWKKLLVPWFEERIYQDARINGTWNAEFHHLGEVEEERIDIKSKGHQIFGSITIVKGKNNGKVYTFQGNFRNLVLVSSYHSKRNSELDRGSFTLLLKKNGLILEGKCTFFSDKNSSIEFANYVWRRADKE